MTPSSTSVSALARTRVSIRKYTDRIPTREEIDDILDIAGRAPSPFNLQPWRVIVVTDPDKKQALKEAAYGQPQVGAAPVVFVLYSHMNDVMENVEETIHPGMADRAEETAKSLRAQYGAMTPEAFHQWGFAESNIMLGYLLLAIQEKGFSSSPMLGFVPDKVKELFGLPDDVTIPALVAMGEAAEDGFPQYRKPLDRWVKYV